MKEPLLADDAFLADVQSARVEPGLRLWWLGQSGFLVQFEGHHLLVDPYLSDSLTRKYAETDTPHVRITRRVDRSRSGSRSWTPSSPRTATATTSTRRR